MALTAAQQTDAYRFFSIAFNAAPGVEYMNQIADAYASGASTKNVVNAFVSKSQFTNVYPTFLTNVAFANNLVENIVGSSAAEAAKTQAKADIVTALNGGLSRGDVIYTIFNNLANKPAADAVWGNTAKMMANKVAVAQYYTEVLLGNTTNLATLQSVLSNVTPATDVSTPAAIQAVLGDVFNAQGQTFVLTGSADQVPGMNGSAGTISTTGNDVYVATNTTLSSADRIVDAAGTADKLKYSSQAAATHAAFEMKGVETLEVTADAAQPVSFDLSGSEGLTLLKTLNSTGNTTYNQVTSLANIEVNNVTNGANVTVSYQDSVVAGTANDVTLTLANNSNVTPVGSITVGSTAVANAGVETISAVVSGAAATVTTLDSNISRLNVAGDKNLTITTALNSTVDTVAAGSFTGALNINLTGNVAAVGEGALSITTGSGNDVIDLLNGTATTTVAEATDVGTVTRNATISTGAGNDTVEAGLGDDNINLGEGNDTLVMTTNGLTVADLINGGAGADTLILNAADSISKSEAERVTQVETVDLRAAGSTFVVTDNLVNTADGGMFTITTANAAGGHTIDLTSLTFSNTNKFTLTGRVATADTVIANDATVNAKAILNFGQNGNGTGLAQADADTLRIVDGGNYTFDDFANVTGLDAIHLTSSSNIAQTWNLQLAGSMIDNNDSTTLGSADLLDDLIVRVDRNVPQNSRVNIDSTQIGASQRVQVYTNTNVQVFVDGVLNGTGVNGRVTVLSTLEFTENADNLVGTAGADLFTADSLDQLDTADLADGGGGTDTLRLDFAVNNPAATLNAMFNNVAMDTTLTVGLEPIEILTFNTGNVVQFNDTAGTYSFTTVNLGSNSDVVIGSGAIARTYNGGEGADTITAGALGDTLNGENGNDVLRGAAGNDTINGGEGADRIADALVAAAGGTDILNGGNGNDIIRTSGGADVITGGAGDDQILSGLAGAAVAGDTAGDTITGGTGVDTIRLDTAGQADTLIFAVGDSVSGSAAGVTWKKAEAVSWDNVTNFTVAVDILDLSGAVVPTTATAAVAVNGIDAVDGANRIGSHTIDANGFVSFFTDDAALTAQVINSYSDLQLAFEYVYKNHTQNEVLYFRADFDSNGAIDSTFAVVNEANGSQSAVQLMGVVASAVIVVA